MRQAFAGMLWSKQLYDYDVRALAGRRPGPAARRRRRGSTAATPAGATSTPSTSCRCRTSGSTPGSPPGTWPSTASRWPTSTRRSPSTSCCCCAGSGSSTRTGRCPPTSGTSATSTRRCRRGRRSRCSPSTAAATSTSSSRVFDKLLVNFTWWVNREDADGLQPVRGRVPRAGQHRPARPLAPAGRRHARAVRRDRLDGVLRAGHGDDRARSCTAAASARRRPRAQVPRALRRDPQRDRRPGAVGRRPTGCSTTGWSPPDGDVGAGEGPVDGRASSRCWPPRVVDEAMLDRAARLGQAVRRASSSARASTTARSSPSRAAPRASPASGGLLLGVVGIDRLRAAVRQAVRRGRVPLALRAAGAVRPTTASTPTSSTSRACARRSTTSPPSRPPRCSAATPTGAARCGSR